MNSRENILLSLLHTAGCSQTDFRKIFLTDSVFVEKIYQEILSWVITYRHIFTGKRYEKIQNNLKKLSFSEREKFLENNNIFLISFFEKSYPERLKFAYQYPFLLYTKGNITLETHTISVVGSRKSTHYGESVLTKIFSEIPYKNISIISGGAYGIDGLSHTLAIKKKLHTIAVFGCGIDVIYPNAHKNLFAEILQNGGGLISSFPLGTEPISYNFPIRNEIVAGLSDSILIPEAGTKSGTLITARLALEQGKDVFAVPGDIFRETSQWCNELINKWEAICALSASDIFSDFRPINNNIIPLALDFENPLKQEEKSNEKVFEKNFSSETAKKIFETIQNGHKTPDIIVQQVNLPIHDLMVELSLLEIDGHIRCDSTGNYECIFY